METLDGKRILTEILSRTIKDRETIVFGTVHSSEIPPGIKSFLHAEISSALYQGISGSDQVARFIRNKGHVTLTNVLAGAVAFEYQFSREEFLTAVEKAIVSVSAYLIQPRLQLEQSVFGLKSSLPAEQVEHRLNLFTDYSYLPVLVRKLMRKQGLRNVSKGWFAEALTAIEARVISRHSQTELARLSHPIFRFALFALDHEKTPLPIAPLRTFYFEKNLHEFWQKVERSLGSTTELCYSDFVRIVAVPGSTVEPLLEEPTPGKGQEPVPGGGQTNEEEAVREEQEQAPERPTSIPEGAEAGEEPAAAADEPSPSPSPLSSPYSVTSVRTEPLPDLAQVITDEQKLQFVRGLFKLDSAYYAAVISSLNDILTWKEAALFLSQFYETNDLDPFADDVVQFTDAVYHRYDRPDER